MHEKTSTITIGIDPDVDKNGVALLDHAEAEMQAYALTFADTLDFLRLWQLHCQDTGKGLTVVIEAGWLNKSNWHLLPRDTKAVAAAKGNNAGRNHETGRKLSEMCLHWGIPFELVKPLRKAWRGKQGKITHAELAALLSRKGIHMQAKRTNQDQRDAALIALLKVKG